MGIKIRLKLFQVGCWVVNWLLYKCCTDCRDCISSERKGQNDTECWNGEDVGGGSVTNFKSAICLRFKVCMALNISIMVFQVVMLCSLIDVSSKTFISICHATQLHIREDHNLSNLSFCQKGLRNTIKILSRIANSWSGFELNGRTSELEAFIWYVMSEL
jgi:hypothetical protein